ncbi:MAG: FtsW/RodA/SpoVE family cell cycle protein [Candidatus Vogelbacteria bacterium]|nr:FtsW/RodA/SpoVE family cell cycle protein [Candidatus Vogelbacteria bacterium]
MRRPASNRRFFFFILIVTLIGFFIFSSASLGLLNRDGASYSRIVFNQLAILIGALAAMIAVSHFNYRHLRRLALPLFLVSLVVSLLVFVPGLGFASGGAQRWISLGTRTFQPSELLKLAFVVYLAAWLSRTKIQLADWPYGLLPFFLIVGVTGATLIAEPDLGTFFVLIAAALAMFFAAGGPWRQVFVVLLLALAAGGSVIAVKPYARERFLTFLNPTENLLTSSYQINQSLIAIGSGGLWGRGFGRSVQKFHYLPEPIGDSIFAVASEEFGLIGGLFIIGIFVAFVVWGLGLARRTADRFGSELIVGIVVLISTGALINIASMLGLLPLTGIPLAFISHGGSSLLFSLVGCGIILNISRHHAKSLR